MELGQCHRPGRPRGDAFDSGGEPVAEPAEPAAADRVIGLAPAAGQRRKVVEHGKRIVVVAGHGQRLGAEDRAPPAPAADQAERHRLIAQGLQQPARRQRAAQRHAGQDHVAGIRGRRR